MKYLSKNPIVVGIIAVIMTYLSLYYKEKQRIQKYPKSKKKTINISVPLVVGAFCWFLSSTYIYNSSKSQSSSNSSNIPYIYNIPNDPCIKLDSNGNSENILEYVSENAAMLNKSNSQGDSENSISYHFVRAGDVVIPDIDVFLDVGTF
jgi:uncharacterized protein with PQ loop repeat